MNIKNIIRALADQGPFPRFVKNLMAGHLKGLLSQRSHQNADGKPKVGYHTKQSAMKAAESMGKKRGVHFSNYKCLHCDNFHIGKNRNNKI